MVAEDDKNESIQLDAEQGEVGKPEDDSSSTCLDSSDDSAEVIDIDELIEKRETMEVLLEVGIVDVDFYEEVITQKDDEAIKQQAVDAADDIENQQGKPDDRVPQGHFDGEPTELVTTENVPGPMVPMTLPQTQLRRQAVRPARPETVPGAQRMIGVGGTPNRTTPIQQGVQERQSNQEPVTNDASVIDGAFLVTPEDEVVVEESSHHLDQDHEVIVGEIVPASTVKRTPWSRYLLWLLAIVVIGGVAIAIFMVVGGGDNPTTSSAQVQGGDGPIIYPPFRDDIPTATVRDMQTYDLHVYWANKWMLDDPNLNKYSRERQLQRFILAAVYYSTDGDNWHNNDGWMDYDVHECDWFHHALEEELKDEPICDEEGNLHVIALANNNLQGQIPDMSSFHSLPYVPHLYGLDFSHNNITGATPALHEGVRLEVINLSYNGFDAIPPGISAVGVHVRVMKVNSNKIQMINTGDAWYLFPNLEVYNVTGNKFSGRIGPQIQTSKKMTSMGAGHNPWGDVIPSEIGLLTDLRDIDLSGNWNMGGTIPTELGLLSKLELVDLTRSMYTGDLPQEWCRPHETEPEKFAVEVLANCSMINCCG